MITVKPVEKGLNMNITRTIKPRRCYREAHRCWVQIIWGGEERLEGRALSKLHLQCWSKILNVRSAGNVVKESQTQPLMERVCSRATHHRHISEPHFEIKSLFLIILLRLLNWHIKLINVYIYVIYYNSTWQYLNIEVQYHSSRR